MESVDNDLRMAKTNPVVPDISRELNALKHSWVLWAHLPQDGNWKLASYKKIATLQSVQSIIAVIESLPDDMVKNCMLFIMKKGIAPMWEDPVNRTGGCFSYKVSNKFVIDVWRDMCFALVGNSISGDDKFINNVTGLTISPKKNFCIIKIWLSNCEFQNPTVVSAIPNLSSYGCLFKKHAPEY